MKIVKNPTNVEIVKQLCKINPSSGYAKLVNYNEQTGEIVYVGKEEVTVDTASEKKSSTRKTSTKVDANPDPIITLDPNKLILTQGAVDLLQVCPDCRVDIKYKKKDKTSVPVIGTDTAFGTKGGNKLTKTNTV